MKHEVLKIEGVIAEDLIMVHYNLASDKEFDARAVLIKKVITSLPSMTSEQVTAFTQALIDNNIDMENFSGINFTTKLQSDHDVCLGITETAHDSVGFYGLVSQLMSLYITSPDYENRVMSYLNILSTLLGGIIDERK